MGYNYLWDTINVICLNALFISSGTQKESQDLPKWPIYQELFVITF